ncbi:MAG: phosphate signaling complex protein PhoU [candidate division Zixibacteria bacterium]|nr:phosphate signaling complex protein PhoU [candidate division Zixibacteria bacterium]
MTKHFQNEIERLKKKILRLAAMVEEALQRAMKATTQQDIELADSVIGSDPTIDSYEIEVEEDCLKILALHQPVAADLRYVIAVLKINSDLERIADLAVNIAERARDLTTRPDSSPSFDLTSMLDTVMKMVRQSVDALVRQDVNMAREVIRNDDIVDEFHREAYCFGLKEMRANLGSIEFHVSLLSVSRNLERIADHATNIAEDVIYMIEGEIVRHQGTGD